MGRDVSMAQHAEDVQSVPRTGEGPQSCKPWQHCPASRSHSSDGAEEVFPQGHVPPHLHAGEPQG